MKWRRILSIIRKEWWHITRDKTSFGLLLISPALALVTMAYAFSIDITDVGIGLLDQDHSPLARQYISQLASTDALRLEAWPEYLDDVESLMMRGQVKAVVIIPAGFERDLLSGRAAGVQVVVDGTDPSTAGHAIRHVGGHTEHFVKEQVAQHLARAGLPADLDDPIDLRLRAWFNPSLESRVYNVPAVIGVIVLLMCLLLTAMAVVREREVGSAPPA